jgi:sirohydrochlorin cobaltochelatase
MKTALVLAGHGSHITPSTAGVVWKHVDALRAMGVADEITAAFWKEMPSFHSVIHSLNAEDITIVPLFTAQGYFTRTVIPAEMGLDGAITRRDGRTLRYTRTLSEHPYLASIVRRRIEDTLNSAHLRGSETAVAVIGHGTARNAESRNATESQASAIREAGVVAEVVAVYLDDTPAIPEIYSLTHAHNIIAVPYFLAPGSHTTLDVPRALGLPVGESVGSVQGRTVYYTPPVGTEESLREVILELAREDGQTLKHLSERTKPAEADCTSVGADSAWRCFPAAGRERILREVEQKGEVIFGQLRLTRTEVTFDGDTGPYETLDNPAALRAWVRENPFRPLATSDDLPRGWRVQVTSPEMLHAVIETVYPGIVGQWDAMRSGLPIKQSLDEVATRQTGMFRRLAGFHKAEKIVAQVCDHCALYPAWQSGAVRTGKIPCPEPCNFWMSRVLGAGREADE